MSSRMKLHNRIVAILLTILTVCSFVMPENNIHASEKFISGYIQNVYNQENGFGSNEVNCIFQSSSGYIWVGTDGGLYRSDGNEFQSINLWDTDRTDVYSINCIMQDSTGILWIGTENYGLFYVQDGNNYHLQDEYYDGIKEIYDVCEAEDGRIYVSTSEGIYYISGQVGDITLTKYEDEGVADKRLIEIEAFGEDIWGINGYNTIYIFNNTGLDRTLDTSEIVGDNLSCIKSIESTIYIGTAGSTVLEFRNKTRCYNQQTAMVDGINNIMRDSSGYLWVCADSGLGYFSRGSFYKVEECEIDSYLSDIIQDYEGNYWISSTRMGVLMLAKSKFVDYNIYADLDEAMVNVVECSKGNTYIGADNGLTILDSDGSQIENELTLSLKDVSVMDVYAGKNGVIWIATFRRYGLIRVAADGTYTIIGRASGMPSMSINCIYELADGRIAAGTDEGIAILESNGSVDKVISYSEGILNTNILCLIDDDMGNIYAGTDGGGLYIIDSNGSVTSYNSDDGINSNTVTSFYKGEEGLWIGTDNGMCFYKESFRMISNIEYSNSIFDILEYNNYIWIICSKGVLKTTEEELLGSDGVSERYFDKNDGLTKTLNTLAKSTVTSDGKLMICCNSGLMQFDTENIQYNETHPRLKITAIDVDDETYEFDDLNGNINVSDKVSRITIHFAVFSYSNRNNIQVEYYLQGFDNSSIVLNGTSSLEAVYTNLDGGTYTFMVSAKNGDGISCEQEISFTIHKEESLTENPITKIVFFVALCVVGTLLCFTGIRIRRILVNKNNALEKLSKEHEVVIKSSSAKNDYLAYVSNEIKTPVNSIMVKADELLQNGIEDDITYDNIYNIYKVADDILVKVDDIILLARLEAGRVELNESSYAISSVMYSLSEYAVSMIKNESIRLFVEMEEDMSDVVVGDIEKVKNVLIRILDNAIKFTKEGSITIMVEAYDYESKNKTEMCNLEFTIVDTGIGIQSERIADLFEVYNIADNKKSGNNGNGVGLAIAKGYADLMGGSISVESEYGAGSAFTFSIIQKKPDNNEKNKADRIKDVVSQEIADELWLPDVNALVVDDNEVSREVALKALSVFEMRIDVATTGITAIDMIMNSEYDVVFMNVQMPVMSGFDAVAEIRELEDMKYAMLPIIAMDSNAMEDNMNSLLAAGFTDSIVKPVSIRSAAAILRDCLPQDKIKEKVSDMEQYIEGSRFRDGLINLSSCVDVENAIEKIGGSIDMYNKLVKAYYLQYQDSIDNLSNKFKHDIRSFKADIHAMKSASFGIGALVVAREASKFESAINIGNKDYIKDNMDQFINDVVTLLNSLDSYVDFIDSISGVVDEQINKDEEKETADIIDIELLKEIKLLAVNSDFEGVVEIFEKINKYTYSSENADFVKVLDEAIQHTDKDLIADLVMTYIDLNM